MAAPFATRTPVELARSWVVDYFNRHDEEAARGFVAPDYALRIGDHLFAGRDAQWLPAVTAQMRRFPGLCMTVHDVLASADKVALYFSEHGADGGPGGPVAVWSGVAIYRSNGQQLVGCVAQEDYATRQRQLRTGLPDPVEPPAAAPWDTVPLAPEPGAEAALSQWLTQAWPDRRSAVRCDDEHITGQSLAFEVEHMDLLECVVSGLRIAFHARQYGRLLGGLPGVREVPRADDARHWIDVNGLVRLEGGSVVGGRVIRDRLGLKARLTQEVCR